MIARIESLFFQLLKFNKKMFLQLENIDFEYYISRKYQNWIKIILNVVFATECMLFSYS